MSSQANAENNSRVRFQERFKQHFDESPIFSSIFKGTIKSANFSYRIAIVLNVLMFLTGVSMVAAAIFMAFSGNNILLSAIFAGFGSTSMVVLLLSRPIERIQTAVNNLIQAQIACLSFQAQYEIIYGMMALKFEVYEDKPEYIDAQLKCSKQLQELTTQVIRDLAFLSENSSK